MSETADEHFGVKQCKMKNSYAGYSGGLGIIQPSASETVAKKR